MNHSIFMSCWI